MTNQEIIQTLDNCIEISKASDNIYVKNKLTEVAEALMEQWNQSNVYDQQIKQVLNYDQTMEDLNNIKI